MAWHRLSRNWRGLQAGDIVTIKIVKSSSSGEVVFEVRKSMEAMRYISSMMPRDEFLRTFPKCTTSARESNWYYHHA